MKDGTDQFRISNRRDLRSSRRSWKSSGATGRRRRSSASYLAGNSRRLARNWKSLETPPPLRDKRIEREAGAGASTMARHGPHRCGRDRGKKELTAYISDIVCDAVGANSLRRTTLKRTVAIAFYIRLRKALGAALYLEGDRPNTTLQ